MLKNGYVHMSGANEESVHLKRLNHCITTKEVN